MQTDPDVALMLQFKAGDPDAFRQLFDRHKNSLILFCFRFCGDERVAQELTQETFIRVYRAAARYTAKARFRTWLFKIATNVCLNEIRKPSYRMRSESLDGSDSKKYEATITHQTGRRSDRPDELLYQEEHRQMVLAAIAQLPVDQRAALLLRIEGEFSYHAIGQQMGRSENNVKTLIYRGRCKLRQALGKYFGDKL
jgi:RNA polymerase sigma-70 factor (ECF subfamily)